ncbi:hypothetical protein ACVWYG_000074 [Pedobacter sp. UYEF25]
MSESLTISSKKPENDALDYEALRTAGIEIIEQTGSNNWTDYNVHDPGIAILELLCYTLTDFSYRASNSIPDLLATPKNAKENILKQFFSAAKIFPNKATTINDFRKIIIDVKGVKNAWLQKRHIEIYADVTRKKLQISEPATARWTIVDVSGYYDVLIEFDLTVVEANKNQIRQMVRAVLADNRNLCEDFLNVAEIERQDFRLCTEIELDPNADPFDAVAQMFFNIQNYLTPIIKFYALKQLIEEGYTADVIFEGPLLNHGFIKEEELFNTDLKGEIHLSDIMQQMLDVPGIENILDIVFNAADQTQALANKWVIAVASGRQPVVNILASNILVYKNGIPLRPDMNIIEQRFSRLMDNYLNVNEAVQTDDITFPVGAFRDVGNYYSIQNHFPKNYGVSHWGLPQNASAERVAQAKQLQAYLYFFDQHLQNSFSQLANLGNLFSTDVQHNTYFASAVESFVGAKDIFLDSASIDEKVSIAVEDRATFYRRRNLFLDHLLARFSESFSEYVNVLYSGFTSNPKEVIIPSAVSPEEIVFDKANFLKNYPQYSSNRFCAYNYGQKDETWDTGNVSGLEKRLEALLGIENLNRRDLVNLQTEILQDLNSSGNPQYWYTIKEYRSGMILLQGTEKFPSQEAAGFALDKTLSLLYQTENFYVVANGDGTFSFQVRNGDNLTGSSAQLYSTMAHASLDQQKLIELVTKKRAEEGLFLVEHMLLLPPQTITMATSGSEAGEGSVEGFLPICVDDGCRNCMDTDPYSFRISVVLPAYAPRFLNIAFRQYAERTIRMEAPAHTFVKICWVGNEQLINFQNAYKHWLDVKSVKVADEGNTRLLEFVTILTSLKSIYPVAKLEDCSSNEERTLFMLNQNALGTLKT